ncbi:hypothetical protein T12_2189 [Trichinella patagoniensis]|uniref:Uncharacterized protein n=1 Tax=Trichinella patagoniensis TaxID=990121 RepID=A0A0V0ZEF2_9BILA|nr:hypothetical protein T12_2189 [Trichinella patagoniensis]
MSAFLVFRLRSVLCVRELFESFSVLFIILDKRGCDICDHGKGTYRKLPSGEALSIQNGKKAILKKRKRVRSTMCSHRFRNCLN